jgi:hypothetical protein
VHPLVTTEFNISICDTWRISQRENNSLIGPCSVSVYVVGGILKRLVGCFFFKQIRDKC